MRYKVRGLEIRSENAAKPIAQASKYLKSWILEQRGLSSLLDYGCGKLRYAGTLYKISTDLTLVDSEIQLSRIQKIGRQDTSVESYAAKHMKRAKVINVTDFPKKKKKYDLVLCANVLSAIPSIAARSTAFRNIRRALSKDGKCLFVAQYKDHYFDEVKRKPTTIPFLDGWIAKNQRGASYYGKLGKPKLESLVTRNGFRVEKSWIHGSSAYVLAGL